MSRYSEKCHYYWTLSGCWYGRDCWFSHDSSPSPPISPRFECGCRQTLKHSQCSLEVHDSDEYASGKYHGVMKKQKKESDVEGSVVEERAMRQCPADGCSRKLCSECEHFCSICESTVCRSCRDLHGSGVCLICLKGECKSKLVQCVDCDNGICFECDRDEQVLLKCPTCNSEGKHCPACTHIEECLNCGASEHCGATFVRCRGCQLECCPSCNLLLKARCQICFGNFCLTCVESTKLEACDACHKNVCDSCSKWHDLKCEGCSCGGTNDLRLCTNCERYHCGECWATAGLSCACGTLVCGDCCEDVLCCDSCGFACVECCARAWEDREDFLARPLEDSGDEGDDVIEASVSFYRFKRWSLSVKFEALSVWGFSAYLETHFDERPVVPCKSCKLTFCFGFCFELHSCLQKSVRRELVREAAMIVLLWLLRMKISADVRKLICLAVHRTWQDAAWDQVARERRKLEFRREFWEQAKAKMLTDMMNDQSFSPSVLGDNDYDSDGYDPFGGYNPWWK